ncbi:MAG: preprotein translocase subunit YajC, partial [Planctomycetota bacterium]
GLWGTGGWGLRVALCVVFLGPRGGGGGGGAAPASGDGTIAGEGADGSAPGAAPTGSPAAGGGFDLLFPLLIGLMLFMIISTMLSGRKEKKRRAEMLNTVSKHAKVQTIGGVIGTVAEVKDTEIVLTVDRATQTRMTFAKSAVQQVLTAGRGDSGAEEEIAEPELERAGV